MRSHRRHDERVVLELLDKALGPREGVSRCLRVRHRKLDDRLAKHAAKSGRFRLARDFLLEVIHVGVRGRPRLNHFERRQPRPGADELRGHGLGFRGKDVLRQPFHQPHIVGQPAVQHHRRVRMRVDEPRHHHLSGCVNRLGASELPRNRIGGINRDNVWCRQWQPHRCRSFGRLRPW